MEVAFARTLISNPDALIGKDVTIRVNINNAFIIFICLLLAFKYM